MDETNNLLKIKEAAKAMHFKEKTLRNWRSQGRFRKFFVKISGKVFVDMEEVNKYIQKQKDEAREKNKTNEKHDQD